MASMENVRRGVDNLSLKEDVAFLTSENIYQVSQRLNNTWKAFARKVGLEAYQVEQIENDFPNVYERSNRVFELWHQRISTPVTIAMLKQYLSTLGRNDILLDVFRVGAVDGDPIQKPEEAAPLHLTKEDLTLADLQQDHRDTLRYKLDPDYGPIVKNWLGLGKKVFENDPDMIRKVEDLKRDYSGGGSPAFAFLETLAANKPNTTIWEFRSILEECKRRDVVGFINKKLIEEKKLKLEEPLRNIDEDSRDVIASFLDKGGYGVSNWRNVASKLGYSSNEIRHFNTAMKSENSYSPTTKLLELIMVTKPDLPLVKLMEICNRIKRVDVEHYLKDVLPDLLLHRQNIL